jgi:16S rRNA (uracil1498-N3)-methyltransferase
VTARRFFVEGTRELGSIVEIEGGDARKIARVLRLREGDHIEVVDSATTAFAASIADLGPVVRARLVEIVRAEREPALLRIDVAQAVPKGRRMELVVEKGSELGAAAFLPFHSERSVGRAAGGEKLARWRRLARTAAQQSGRRDVPTVDEPLDFSDLLARFEEYEAVVFAWELAAPAPLYERLRDVLPREGRALIVVGPEGGFTHDEAASAEEKGASLLWLGPRILRTDTAAIALLAVIGALAS